MFLKPKHLILECRSNFGSLCSLPGPLRAIVFSAPNSPPPFQKFPRTPLTGGEGKTPIIPIVNYDKQK